MDTSGDGGGRDSFLATNGVRLHVVEAGPEGGRPVILLHGFPEFWYGWRHQIGPLAGAGFHILAPDQRGYGPSDKPKGVAAYALDVLADDVAGLIASTGQGRAALVGHDWGGIVAWWAAIRHPEMVSRLAVRNAPHPLAFRRFLRRSPGQWLRSWYAFWFQVPRLPEALFRRRNWRALADGLRSTSRPGTFRDEEMERYRAAWSEPGAITAMIDWYRAAAREPIDASVGEGRVGVPTLMIWGKRDRFIDPRMAALSLARCDGGRLELFDEATHWVQHEEAGRVNALLAEFLGGDDGTPPTRPGGAAPASAIG